MKPIYYLLVIFSCVGNTIFADETAVLENETVVSEQVEEKSLVETQEEVVLSDGVTDQQFQLNVSERQGAIIREIVVTMGRTNVLALGFKQGHLRALGKKLGDVGAMQFLGYIFTQQHLSKYMKSIYSSSFKWNGFVDGLKPGLDKEADTNELFTMLPGFSKAVEVSYDPLLSKAKERDWPGFIAVMVKSKNRKKES